MLSLVLLSAGCEGDSLDRPLSSTERREVSRRYADSVRLLTPTIDSLCGVNTASIRAALVDSIYSERIADLERQRKRFEQ